MVGRRFEIGCGVYVFGCCYWSGVVICDVRCVVRGDVLVGLVACIYAGNKVFFGRGVWMNHIGGLALKRFNSYVLITPYMALRMQRQNACDRYAENKQHVITYSLVK